MLKIITNQKYMPKIGTMQKAIRANAIKHPLTNIRVCQAQWRDIQVTIETENDQRIITLSSHGAIELVKAILSNLEDVTIAVDEELLKIVNSAKERSDEDARAVVACLRERNFGK